MSPFVPTGYLSLSDAIDRVAEIMNGSSFISALAQEERSKQQLFREGLRPPRPEVIPVPKVGRNESLTPRPSAERVARSTVEAEPPAPEFTAEEIRDLMTRETHRKEQQHAAGEELRQLLEAGRVPSKTITKMGYCIKTPKHVWGGNWWYMALKINTIQHAHGLGVSVFGRPVIRRDALEAAFNPDGTVKEGPGPVAQEATIEEAAEQSGRGRKSKWDWDGAVGHLLSVANSPDGLPDIQADIERLVAAWFRDIVDDEPSESLIRNHVSTWCKGVLG